MRYMRYKIFCSNGYDPDIFYCDNKDQANLLFNMAVACKFFKYVEMAEITGEYISRRKEWSAEENEIE